MCVSTENDATIMGYCQVSLLLMSFLLLLIFCCCLGISLEEHIVMEWPCPALNIFQCLGHFLAIMYCRYIYCQHPTLSLPNDGQVCVVLCVCTHNAVLLVASVNKYFTYAINSLIHSSLPLFLLSFLPYIVPYLSCDFVHVEHVTLVFCFLLHVLVIFVMFHMCWIYVIPYFTGSLI